MTDERFKQLLSAYRSSDLGKYMSFPRVLLIYKHLMGYRKLSEISASVKKDIEEFGHTVVCLTRNQKIIKGE